MNQIFRQISGKDWKNDVYAIWSLTRGHAGRLAIAIICSLMLSSINGAIAWLVKDVLDNLAGEKNRVFLMLLPFGVFLLFSLRGFFSFANSFLMGSIGAKIVRTLRQAMYEKLLRLPMSFYSKKSSGSIISRLINDTAILETQIPFTAKNFFVQSTTVVILAFVALYRKWDLAILSFTIIPLIVIVSDRFGRRMKKTSSKTRRLISKVTEIIHETLAGMRIIKSFTMEEPLSKRNESAVSEHYRNVMREVRINEFTSSFMEVIAGSGIAVLLWYGFYLIVKEKTMIKNIFILGLLMIGLSSCFKEDDPIPPHQKSDVKQEIIPLTQYYVNQVYFNLSTGKQVSTNNKNNFDLSFSCADTAFIIRLNTAKFMKAGITESTDMTKVTDTTGLNWKFDKSDGNPDSTAFVDWIKIDGFDTTCSNRVYVINRGFNEMGFTLGLKKIVFHNLKNGTYYFSWSNMDNSEMTEVTIKKNAGYNYIQYSFDNGGDIKQIEPESDNWDLLFTQYTTMLFTSEGDAYPYIVTGVLTNPGTLVAFDSTDRKSVV